MKEEEEGEGEAIAGLLVSDWASFTTSFYFLDRVLHWPIPHGQQSQPSPWKSHLYSVQRWRAKIKGESLLS